MTDKPRILITRRLPPNVEARARRDYDCRFNADHHPWDAGQLVRRAARCDAILCCPTERFTADLIARLPPGIKMIASFSVGVDHLDLDAARARGIQCANTPDVLSDATAEIAILCMLGAARRAWEGMNRIMSDDWSGWSPTFMLGGEITGKRLGIVGMGRVGRATAQRARGFDMEIHYHNRSRLDPHRERGAIYHDAIEDLLRVSEVLSLHCPATPETAGLLDARRIALLPDGAVVVNTARGALVDDQALIDALKSGKLRGAGLDVFNGEPHRIHPGYRKLENVFLLPHLGSATDKTRDAMGFRALDNLDAFFSDREPPDRVA